MIISSQTAPRAGLLLLLAWACDLSAQLPVARLGAIFPPGGRAGTELEAAVSGQDLDEPAGLRFSHPGITAALKQEANQFAITIGSNVPPGFYEARFVG